MQIRISKDDSTNSISFSKSFISVNTSDDAISIKLAINKLAML